MQQIGNEEGFLGRIILEEVVFLVMTRIGFRPLFCNPKDKHVKVIKYHD
jgi:hypothetical protein